MRKPRTKARRSDYEIGKGRPPVATRWKPGQSGNPNGRRKGTKNTNTIFYEALMKKIEIQERGQLRRVTVLEAIAFRLINSALKGDQKAIAFIFDMAPQIMKYAAPIERPRVNATAEELAKHYFAMVKQVRG